MTINQKTGDDTCPNGAVECSNAPGNDYDGLECFACFIDDNIGGGDE